MRRITGSFTVWYPYINISDELHTESNNRERLFELFYGKLVTVFNLRLLSFIAFYIADAFKFAMECRLSNKLTICARIQSIISILYHFYSMYILWYY